jgi:DNA-binding transcriptional MerR regulator
MTHRRTYLVKEVAALSGVSVRALHHYDAIGLLAPSGRTAAGYRLYDDDDLLRLQQIVVGRELGLSLEAIRCSLEDPAFDRRGALVSQRAELTRRAERAEAMIRAIDAALTTLEENDMSKVDMKRIFEGFDPAAHAPEAERRWGGTESYREAMQRTAAYTEADWRELKQEQAEIYGAAAAALAAGVPPDDGPAMDLAERHRQSIERWFYPCSPSMHAGLADLWESDARFGRNIDKFGAGLTQFFAAAVRANSARASR